MLSSISNPKSICLLRLSAIGDVCHAVASVQAIQQRWPQAKITWIIGKVEYQLLKGLAGVEFVVFDKKAGWRAYWQLWRQLHSRQFDILLHMQVALRASVASLCIRAKEKWGFDKDRAKEAQWLFTNRQIPAQTEPHVADGFLAFAQAIGVAADHQLKWQMPMAEVDELWQQERLGQFEPYIVIAPAASKAERNWLAERYAQVASHAHHQGYRVVICGGPTVMEQTLAKKIQACCDSELINLVGQSTLKQLLLVLKQAKLVIAPDTGPAHMAVTVGTPVIGLYAHSNPKRTGPYSCQHSVVSAYAKVLQEQSGMSVEQNRWGKRVKGQDLMAHISLEEVIRQFDQVTADIEHTHGH